MSSPQTSRTTPETAAQSSSPLTVRKLPDSVKRRLQERAHRHGRSTEAEIRLILAAAVDPDIAAGSALAAFAFKHRLSLDETVARAARDQAA